VRETPQGVRPRSEVRNDERRLAANSMWAGLAVESPTQQLSAALAIDLNPAMRHSSVWVGRLLRKEESVRLREQLARLGD
jgi:hypothetical protein